jgi:D-3-phosphoglycerate dehydrogenase / 2-oxoglutarate reductase
MIRILITDKIAKEAIDLINSTAGAEAVVKHGLKEDELIGIIGEYDGLLVRSETKVTPKVLANPGKLRAIGRAGAGVDNIDVPSAKAKNIMVMNTPGGNTISVAEHVFALTLALIRHVVPACNSLKAGVWDKKKFMGNQLNKKVLGIIGLGKIGLAVAERAKAFNMKLLGYDPYIVPPDAKRIGIEIADKVERIYKEADFITVHVPKSKDTINMLGAEQIAMMKPTVRLINTARGGIINEDALYDALANNRIAGAALDVYSEEPPKNTKFMKFDNCIVTPHLGANSSEAQIECGIEAAQIVLDYLMGKGAKNVVKG